MPSVIELLLVPAGCTDVHAVDECGSVAVWLKRLRRLAGNLLMVVAAKRRFSQRLLLRRPRLRFAGRPAFKTVKASLPQSFTLKLQQRLQYLVDRAVEHGLQFGR